MVNALHVWILNTIQLSLQQMVLGQLDATWDGDAVQWRSTCLRCASAGLDPGHIYKQPKNLVSGWRDASVFKARFTIETLRMKLGHP